MKTLILNGSTKKNGDTHALVDAFTGALEGEVRSITYFDHITPYLDCCRCWKRPGCSIDDKMQEDHSLSCAV